MDVTQTTKGHKNRDPNYQQNYYYYHANRSIKKIFKKKR